LFFKGVWKDALRTKLKRKRSENRDHVEVREYQMKYARIGSGRPLKKRTGELAPRDRQKQVKNLIDTLLTFFSRVTLCIIDTVSGHSPAFKLCIVCAFWL